MLMESNEKFGHIVIGLNETLFGTLCGKNHEVLHKFPIEQPIPMKYVKGVHSGNRRKGAHAFIQFARLRRVRLHDYLRKTAELANQYYINPSTNQPNVDGLILSHSADLVDFRHELFLEFNMHPLLNAKVLEVLEVSNGVENGFNEAIAMNVNFIREKHLIGKYLLETRPDTGYYVFDVDRIMNVLESKSGAVKTLIVLENLDINRYVMKNRTTGEIVIKYLNKEQEDNIENFKELDVEEKMPLLGWLANNVMRLGYALELVTDKTKYGRMFCNAFGGIGGLHYLIDDF